jgi:hypothetical protein
MLSPVGRPEDSGDPTTSHPHHLHHPPPHCFFSARSRSGLWIAFLGPCSAASSVETNFGSLTGPAASQQLGPIR